MAENGDKVEVLERGNIYFAYRPKVDEEEPEGLGDVQRLYVVLGPQEGRHRLISVGAKRMPEVGDGGDQYWSFVEMVTDGAEKVEGELQGETYETKTRGERHRPASRPAGEGVYALARHGDHTHLAYVLELPEGPGEVQKAFNIEEEASYVISVKNPEQPSPRGAGLSEERQAEYPKRLQGRFQDRRFIAVDPPDFLDYEGAEILFVGASGDVSEELGIDLDAEGETESTAEVFEELRMEKDRHPVEPLLKGKWE